MYACLLVSLSSGLLVRCFLEAHLTSEPWNIFSLQSGIQGGATTMQKTICTMESFEGLTSPEQEHLRMFLSPGELHTDTHA